jgi:hypothetical protein
MFPPGPAVVMIESAAATPGNAERNPIENMMKKIINDSRVAVGCPGRIGGWRRAGVYL